MNKLIHYFLFALAMSFGTLVTAQNNQFILHNGTGQPIYISFGINASSKEVVDSGTTQINHNYAFSKIVSLPEDNIKFAISYSPYIYKGAAVTIYEIDKSFLNPKTDSVVLRVTQQNGNTLLNPLSSFETRPYPNNITTAEIHKSVVTK